MDVDVQCIGAGIALSVNVRVSYQGGEIAIDDHLGKGKSDTRLSFSPEWRGGSTYRIKATESRLVENLDISVLAM